MTNKDKNSIPQTGSNTSAGKHKKRKRKRSIFLSILIVIGALILMACLAVAGYVIALSFELPEITADDLVQAQTSFVYDDMGQEIAALHGSENRTTVTLDQMPDYLLDMVIASEDVRFYDHHGVDFRGVIRAVVIDVIDSIKNREVTFTQGASTITMQLVRNVIDDREMALKRKIKEALLAMEFEKQYDKDQILYYYVNEIYLGPEIYGMQAASEYYFDKDVSDISVSEAALLVGLIRNPGWYSPYNNPDRAISIRNTVLDLLVEYDSSYTDVATAAKADDLVVYEGSGDDAGYDYPWFVDYVISEASDALESVGLDPGAVYTGGLHIYTTMDVNVQSAMESAYADDSNFPSSSTGDIVESAMLIMEPTTGEIKGLVGGRVYETRRGFNRATDLQRSPGSTIKPVVAYGPAVDLGYGSGTVIDDSPVGFNSSYSPKNDDWSYKGRITMRQAIVESRNVCAVKVLQTIGESVGWEYGIKMGLPLVAADANSALTLGGLTYGVAPVHMAGAFSTFANSGVYIEPHAISKITDAKGNVIYTANPKMTEVMSEGAAYIVTDMLTSAVNYGTGTRAKVSGWQTAGKTGTNGLPTEDPDFRGRSGTKDAWFVGYTTALTGAVWIGYDNKKDADGNLQYLSNVYGGTYPARLFNTVMTRALESYENKSFSRPDDVVSASVDTKTGGAPTELTPSQYISSELYVRGYGPSSDGSAEWVATEICADSGEQAGDFCPNRTQGVFLQLAEGSEASPKAADYSLYISSKTCSIHTTPTGDMSSAYVCLDPRHNGELFLANVSSSGSGGCPSEYVQLRYFTRGTMPSRYCNLDDHQITGSNGREDMLETPYDLSVSSGADYISISWQDSNNANTTSYVIEKLKDGGSRTKIWVYGKSYTDADVESGHTYSYRVYAYNESTEKTSGWSSQASIGF